jgi:hypothetical protein
VYFFKLHLAEPPQTVWRRKTFTPRPHRPLKYSWMWPPQIKIWLSTKLRRYLPSAPQHRCWRLCQPQVASIGIPHSSVAHSDSLDVAEIDMQLPRCFHFDLIKRNPPGARFVAEQNLWRMEMLYIGRKLARRYWNRGGRQNLDWPSLAAASLVCDRWLRLGSNLHLAAPPADVQLRQ